MAEQFEAYFQRADLDRDGRISGAEAVAFFQGSGLPKNVLAQIWGYSDPKNAGYLGRAEFFNALRLVTVAQSGRELTPDIVKAALEGPAAARIPAPRINPVATQLPQVNPSVQRPQFNNMMPSSTAVGTMPPTSYQNLGFRGPQPQVFPNTGTSPQMFPPAGSQFVRPAQVSSVFSSVQMPPASQGPSGGTVASVSHLPGSNVPNLSTDWFGGRNAGAPPGATSQLSSRGFAPSNQDGFGLGSVNNNATTTSILRPQTVLTQVTSVPKALDPLAALVQPTGQDSKALVVSGNGFSSDPGFGNDVFSVSQPRLDAVSSNFSASRTPSTTVSSVLVGSQTRPVSAGFSQSLPTTLVGDGSLQASQLPTKQTQLDNVANSVAPASRIGTGISGSQPEVSWPKMTQSNIQKYTKVFFEVDKDRDGRITGQEARNLFLSWTLPREVLKKIWDLSDQDNDGMLTISEFCIALYLMERYREGRPLPSVLPNSLKFDDTLLQVSRQSSAVYGGVAWQPNPGPPQQGAPGVSPQSVPAFRPHQQIQAPRNQFDGQMQGRQQKVTAPSLSKQPANQFGNEEQGSLTASNAVLSDADSKVKELENEIMDSREKLEYYRTKMQDLVLYKSRCDNKLNEITENASASKREMEDLAKRYEEKYKQVGEIASKLTVEEATFRDIQERKLELQSAIVKMEQGGSTDGLLQVRADRIQSDLEELWKALNDRCKKHGLDVKSTVVVELPFGWQPGIQEGAADWDEDWDKFDDEGFILPKDLTVGTKSSSGLSNALYSDVASPDALDDAHKRHDVNGDSAYVHSEDGSERSAPGSPGRSTADSPTREFLHQTKFDNHDASPRLDGTNSDHGGVESFFTDDKYGDESSWGGAFDAGDDTDSVWGFNATNKEFGDEPSKQSSFYDTGDFGMNASKNDSPTTSSVFGKEKSPFFAESVPGTPSFHSGPSPRSNEDRGFDNSFGRLDSFGAHGNLTRFDSIRSTADFDHGGPFGQPDSLTRFDSVRSSRDSDHNRGFHSFDEADPFGTGPFKPSETLKRSSDSWSAF